MTMASTPVDLSDFHHEFGGTTELSSVALGGSIVNVSDDFFAAAHHLIVVEPAPSLKGQFGPNGALYSGWESRRHNPTFDWCILKLGTSGTIVGFDVDTTHFNGNEAPEVSVDALLSTSGEKPGHDSSEWSEILPRVPLGPSSRHLFKIPETTRYNYVKLNMYPDGGIARFRVYGHVASVYPDDPDESFDLAHVFAGGRVVLTSDQHFGVGSNLLLPGRGKDMGDGWETKRSRQKGHKDWVIIKLGAPGILSTTEIDTAHFKGNFPESCELQALESQEDVPNDDQAWVTILPKAKLGPHRRHFFELENVAGKVYTHVKATIYPDGGIKRVRLIGVRADVSKGGRKDTATSIEGTADIVKPEKQTQNHDARIVPVLPLTPEAFVSYGEVIQAYTDLTAAPRGTRITPANQGTANKFHKLALMESSYPNKDATLGLSVYRCQPVEATVGGFLDVTVLERHPYTTQAFVPMGGGGQEGDEVLKDPGNTYLVVVAKNGADDKPDASTLRAFMASGGQGIMYKEGQWHQPMTVLGKYMDFTCVETQIGNGDPSDCEIVELKEDQAVKLKLPTY